MKKAFLPLLAVAALMASCGGSKAIKTEDITKHAGTAAALVEQISPNSTAADIAKLFAAMDTNGDKSVAKDEAVGKVAENFDALDTDKSAGLDLAELGGLLGMLK
ncbi:hypothetical protein [Sediminicola luteus]|uniref:EF-hand domain-containing protein n=1 Tax=Sediminicola luteus TaxID=319238 RepID=A0A2A4G731_9FLAO|nr:hypothetical protein [Sediminicola luteus]PCE63778.1 hypothetical protein B7P33_10930 [Sediminicola luteus]